MDSFRGATSPVPCSERLPDLEVPMITTIVNCLGREHRKLDERIMQLAFGASRLVCDADSPQEAERIAETWSEIEQDLWPHLQIEDELVLSWGQTRSAIGPDLIARLAADRKELHELLVSLPKPNDARGANHYQSFARTLLAIVQKLDAHIERYDSEVLPAILRALYNDRPVGAKPH